MTNQVAVHEINYTHEYIWRSAMELQKHAELQLNESYYFLLPSLLMYFMAYEAFVNFCGVILLPKLWEDEKEQFKLSGIGGKLEAIVKGLPAFSWHKGQRPYQTINDIKSFRNLVSHGKVIKSNYIAEQDDNGHHFKFILPWDRYMTVEYVTRAKTDIKEFCQSLVIEIRKQPDCHSHEIYDAFDGSLSTAIGSAI